MIGIVIVAHGGFADELLKATEHVVGPLEAARSVGLNPKDDLSERRQEIETAIAEVDRGAGVVIVTDLFGGTPSNLAIAAMARFTEVDVVTGANLPMMMKLATCRGLPRRAAVEKSVEAGRKYMMDVESVLDPADRRAKSEDAKVGEKS